MHHSSIKRNILLITKAAYEVSLTQWFRGTEGKVTTLDTGVHFNNDAQMIMEQRDSFTPKALAHQFLP